MATPKPSTRKDSNRKPSVRSRRPSDVNEAEERDPSQAWYWTKEWQEAERKADEDLEAGRYKTFATMEEFLADLDDDDDE